MAPQRRDHSRLHQCLTHLQLPLLHTRRQQVPCTPLRLQHMPGSQLVLAAMPPHLSTGQDCKAHHRMVCHSARLFHQEHNRHRSCHQGSRLRLQVVRWGPRQWELEGSSEAHLQLARQWELEDSLKLPRNQVVHRSTSSDLLALRGACTHQLSSRGCLRLRLVLGASRAAH